MSPTTEGARARCAWEVRAGIVPGTGHAGIYQAMVITSEAWEEENRSEPRNQGNYPAKRLNRIRRETQQILKHWDNRLVIPFTKLAERYLSGHLDFHLHIRGRANGGEHFWV
jgi:hypothetical protein